jgi:uncharacterized membrane protein YdjX (TVP38/TMEM64 family)
MVCGLLAAGYMLRHAAGGWIKNVPANASGAALLVLVGGLLTAIGLPRPALAFAAGTVFGAAGGATWSMLGQMLGCALDFFAARTVAGDWARRRLTGRWRRLDNFILAQPFTATLTLRLLPVGNNMAVNLLAGVAGVRPLPFLAGSLVGYVPQTLIFALLGSGLQVGKSTQLAVGLGLFVVSGVLGAVMWRRGRDQAARAVA